MPFLHLERYKHALKQQEIESDKVHRVRAAEVKNRIDIKNQEQWINRIDSRNEVKRFSLYKFIVLVS